MFIRKKFGPERACSARAPPAVMLLTWNLPLTTSQVAPLAKAQPLAFPRSKLSENKSQEAPANVVVVVMAVVVVVVVVVVAMMVVVVEAPRLLWQILSKRIRVVEPVAIRSTRFKLGGGSTPTPKLDAGMV